MLWLFVGPTGVYLLDFFCSGIQFYLLLSPYLCFISLLYLDLYVLGDDAFISWGLSCKSNTYESWSTSELRLRLAPLNWLKPSRKYFTDRSKAVLLMWIFYIFFSVLCLLCLCARLFICALCHLLGKGWPLGSCLWCLTVSLSLSHWYPGSGVVLDCIDSWSLHPYLLRGLANNKGTDQPAHPCRLISAYVIRFFGKLHI